MAKVVSVTCDSCGRDIANENYQTMSVRRYAGGKHDKVTRIPAIWLCDSCYRKIISKIICGGCFERGDI